MNHELAKKLKDADFPYKAGDGTYAQSFNSETGEITEAHYLPGLSELIEACGENKPTLRPWNVFEWQASVPHPTVRQLVMGTGKTPEEAVANLWLELNKK